MGGEPGAGFGEGFVVDGESGFLEEEGSESGGVGVGAGLLRGFVVRVPGAEGG